MKLLVFRATIASLMALFFTACATPAAGPHDTSSTPLAADEGIVVGSFMVRAQSLPAGQAEPGLFDGTLAKKATYSMSIRHRVFIAYPIRIDIAPDQEVFFVRRLKAGRHDMQSFSMGGLTARYHAEFDVQPGKTLYLGKYNFEVPPILKAGVSYHFERAHDFDQAKAHFAKTHPHIAQSMQPYPHHLHGR